MNRLVAQIEHSIHSRQLAGRGQKILIAVSGGMDSMVLLRILYELSRRNHWKLAVAHLNHQLRGRRSDADERLVRRTAERRKLRIIVGREEVGRFARENKISLEMAARKLRHEFLAGAAKRINAACVALAHHADDQVELFFVRLFRGNGGEGLAGMKWRSPSPSDPGTELIRPLLNVSKEELRRYAAENKVAFREDATNALLAIQRNRIRQELLPLLRDNYQPAVRKTVLRVMETVGSEAEFVTSIASEWLKNFLGSKAEGKGTAAGGSSFEDLPLAIQRRCLQLQLRQNGIEGEFDLIEQLRVRPNSPVAVGQAKAKTGRQARLAGLRQMKIKTTVPLLVTRDSAGLVSFQKVDATGFNDASQEFDLGNRGGAHFDGIKLSWEIRPGKLDGVPKSARGQEVFDADKVGSRITLRHWRPGDRFQPIGMKSCVKLQDIFTNEHVPRTRRHQLTVAVTAQGELFWVEGLRISERFKLTKRTNRRLHWRWQGL